MIQTKSHKTLRLGLLPIDVRSWRLFLVNVLGASFAQSTWEVISCQFLACKFCTINMGGYFLSIFRVQILHNQRGVISCQFFGANFAQSTLEVISCQCFGCKFCTINENLHNQRWRLYLVKFLGAQFAQSTLEVISCQFLGCKFSTINVGGYFLSISWVHVLHNQRPKVLFDDAYCFEASTATSAMVKTLAEPMVVRMPGGVTKMIGGDVTDELKAKCLRRMQQWVRLGEQIIHSEFPNFELLQAMGALKLDTDLRTARRQHVGTQLRRLSKTLCLNAAVVEKEFDLLLPVAISGHRRGEDHTSFFDHSLQ